jgi:AcrR family transcriptional regulator
LEKFAEEEKVMEKRDTRLAIIEAAVEIFAQKGYERATVDEIAAKANLAKGTIFYNFKTKEDIFFAIIEQGTEKFMEMVGERSALAMNATQKIELTYGAAFEFFQKYHNYCTLLISELWRIRTRWNYEPTNLLDRYKQMLELDFIEGQQSGEFRRDIEAKDVGLIVFFLAAVSSLSKALSAEPGVEQKLFDRTHLIFMKGISVE